MTVKEGENCNKDIGSDDGNSFCCLNKSNLRKRKKPKKKHNRTKRKKKTLNETMDQISSLYLLHKCTE